MGLALDGSTPAAVTATNSVAAGATNTLSTASFTPPSGAVLVVFFCTNSGTQFATNSAFAATDNLVAHLTYTQQSQFGNASADTQATVWTSSAIGASTAMTVSASYRNTGSTTDTSTPALLRVLVMTGANATNPAGANGGARGLTANVNTVYAATVGGSWGWLAYADWTASGIPTVPAAETVDSSFNSAGSDTFAVIKQISTTLSVGTTVTISTLTPNSATQISYAYLESVPSGVGPTIGSVPSGAALTTPAFSPKFLFFDTGDYGIGV